MAHQAGVLDRKGQHVGAERGRAVSYGQPHQIGLAGGGEVRIDFDRGVELLLVAVDRDQFVSGLDLCEKRQLLLLLAVEIDRYFLGAQRQDVAIGLERLVGRHPADMFHVHARGIGRAVVAGGHFGEPAALDYPSIDGCAFDGDAEELSL